MSDYGDYDDDYDFDFWDGDYAYIEESYHAADELAERAVASPPPYAGDDDWYEDYDRFAYWNDIEEGAEDDGPNTRLPVLTQKDTSRTGQKRRSSTAGWTTSKKQKSADGTRRVVQDRQLSPTPTVLWLSRESRLKDSSAKKIFDDSVQPYALMKDWREKLPATSPSGKPSDTPSKMRVDSLITDHDANGEAPQPRTSKTPIDAAPLSPSPDSPDEDLADLLESSGLDQQTLQMALQNRLSASGAPAEGLDQSILLKYAVRMLASGNESYDIAGELAEDLLTRAPDDTRTAGISAWVSQQASASKRSKRDASPQADDTLKSPPSTLPADQRPPTPSSTETTSIATPNKSTGPNTLVGVFIPSSDRNKPDLTATAPAVSQIKRKGKGPARTARSSEIAGEDSRTTTEKPKLAVDKQKLSTSITNKPATTGVEPHSRKRKAEPETVGETAVAPKPKRAARSYNAPTTASKSKTAVPASAKTTRSGRVRSG